MKKKKEKTEKETTDIKKTGDSGRWHKKHTHTQGSLWFSLFFFVVVVSSLCTYTAGETIGDGSSFCFLSSTSCLTPLFFSSRAPPFGTTGWATK